MSSFLTEVATFERVECRVPRMSINGDARAGRQVGTTFDSDVHTRVCTSPPNVVCALWPTALLSDDTRRYV
jgi:hypothetical protein